MEHDDAPSPIEIRIEPGKYRPLPHGIYRATLVDVKEAKGKFEDVYKPHFEIAEEPYKFTTLYDLINRKNAGAKNSKLAQMIRALKPDLNLDIFETIDLNSLKDCECYIKVERRGMKDSAITQYFSIKDLDDAKRSSAQG